MSLLLEKCRDCGFPLPPPPRANQARNFLIRSGLYFESWPDHRRPNTIEEDEPETPVPLGSQVRCKCKNAYIQSNVDDNGGAESGDDVDYVDGVDGDSDDDIADVEDDTGDDEEYEDHRDDATQCKDRCKFLEPTNQDDEKDSYNVPVMTRAE